LVNHDRHSRPSRSSENREKTATTVVAAKTPTYKMAIATKPERSRLAIAVMKLRPT
jgi:hypothetical protein